MKVVQTNSAQSPSGRHWGEPSKAQRKHQLVSRYLLVLSLWLQTDKERERERDYREKEVSMERVGVEFVAAVPSWVSPTASMLVAQINWPVHWLCGEFYKVTFQSDCPYVLVFCRGVCRSCGPGQECNTDRTVCVCKRPESCIVSREGRVCAENAQNYISRCHLEVENCRLGRTLAVQWTELAQKVGHFFEFGLGGKRWR